MIFFKTISKQTKTVCGCRRNFPQPSKTLLNFNYFDLINRSLLLVYVIVLYQTLQWHIHKTNTGTSAVSSHDSVVIKNIT